MDKWYSIKIINNSSKDILVLPGYAKYEANEYPDTCLYIPKLIDPPFRNN